jgi:hypothetical protein
LKACFSTRKNRAFSLVATSPIDCLALDGLATTLQAAAISVPITVGLGISFALLPVGARNIVMGDQVICRLDRMIPLQGRPGFALKCSMVLIGMADNS